MLENMERRTAGVFPVNLVRSMKEIIFVGKSHHANVKADLRGEAAGAVRAPWDFVEGERY